jgi:Rrf2 family protein
MLSSKAKYALRAVVILAEEAPSARWTSAAAIAERAAVPRKFLEAILVELRDNGLLESRRGLAGGHRLTGAGDRISLADIIRVTDGPIALTPCASRTEFAPCKDCEDVKTCALRHVMLRVRDAAAAVLEGTSVNDLLVLGREKDENST